MCLSATTVLLRASLTWEELRHRVNLLKLLRRCVRYTPFYASSSFEEICFGLRLGSNLNAEHDPAALEEHSKVAI